MARRFGLLLAAVSCCVLAACGSPLRSAPPIAEPPPPPDQAPAAAQPPSPASPSADPVDVLIRESQRHFEAGRREADLGRLEHARAEFDQAIGLLLRVPSGARADARLRDHFDRLVDKISAIELSALAAGSAEKPSEPAAIDELLAHATFLPDSPPASLRKAVESDLRQTTHDLPISLNPRVLAYIDLFQGRLREFIQDGLARGSRYLPMIQSVLRAEGLPLDLAYVPLVESAFKPNALSRAKAKGVWQFIRGTGLEHGLKQTWFVDERSDPEKATSAAARYLRTLHQMFGDDWLLALASYNGGPARVERALKRARSSDFWTLASKAGLLPTETREYVPMILAAIVIARNPAQYGLIFDPLPPLEYEKVTLEHAIDLRRIAEWAQIAVDDLRELNPELRQWATPPGVEGGYELKVPKGTAAIIRQRLADAPAGSLATFQWYTVRRGESLTSIARKLGVARAELADANNLGQRAPVTPGQRLIIPRQPTTLMAARAARAAPVVESRSVVSSDPIVTGAPEATESGLVKVHYRVKRGDTLSSIARLFRTSVRALMAWNKLRGSRIVAGTVLTIFAAPRVAAANGAGL